MKKKIDSIDLADSIMNNATKDIEKKCSNIDLEYLDHRPQVYKTLNFDKFDIQIAVKILKK